MTGAFSGKSAMLLGLLKDYNKLGKIPKIRMIVIYTADVLRGTTRSETDMYSLTFTLTEAFLSELDCSAVRRTIEEIVNTRQDVTSEEMMQLIIYPLAFRNPNDKQSAIRQVIELAKKLNNEKKKYFILKCLMVFTDKIIRDEEARQIMEVLTLTKVERLMYEEMAKDIAKKFLRKGDDVDTVSECTSLPRDIVVQLVEDIAREKEQ